MSTEKDVAQLFGLSAPTPFDGKKVTEGVPQPERWVGVELEIEGFAWATTGIPGVSFHNDGSLRNMGVEAITAPTAIHHLEDLLLRFFKKYPTLPENYSERCSVHVHFNVLDLTVEELASICLVYQTVERLLFTFVHEDRSKNIFCVPWYQSGLTYNYVSELTARPNKVRDWQKYTALNLLPISEQGTIEFRHMEGTGDVKRILTWVYILAKIFDYSLSRSLDTIKDEILNMNTISNYREWLNSVFGKYADTLMTNNKFEEMLSKGVVDSKYMLMKKVDSVPITPTSMFTVSGTTVDHQFNFNRGRTATALDYDQYWLSRASTNGTIYTLADPQQRLMTLSARTFFADMDMGAKIRVQATGAVYRLPSTGITILPGDSFLSTIIDKIDLGEILVENPGNEVTPF